MILFVRKLRKKDHVRILQADAVNGGGGPNAAATFSFGNDSATLGQGATGINV